MNAAARLRVATAGDAAAIRAIYAPHVEHTAVSFETEAPGIEAMAARIERLLPTYPWLVALVDERVAGYAYASPHRERAAYRWSVETTAYVHADFYARGIGKRLYAALHAVLKAQKYVNAFGIITLPNAASVALHEACGFRRCATFLHAGYKSGAWHNVGWWQLQVAPPAPVPAEPVAFAKLDRATLARALGAN